MPCFFTYEWIPSFTFEHFRHLLQNYFSFMIYSLEVSYWLLWWWVLIWFVSFVCELMLRAFSSAGVQHILWFIEVFPVAVLLLSLLDPYGFIGFLGSYSDMMWIQSMSSDPGQIWGWFLMGALFLFIVHGEHLSLQRRLLLHDFWLYVPLTAFCCVQGLKWMVRLALFGGNMLNLMGSE